MAGKAKVVLTDYVWESLDVEKKTLAGLADLVPLQTKKPDEFLAEAADCDALLNTYAGPITADVMAKMPKCKIIARYGIGVDTIDLDAATAAGIIVTNNPTYCIEEVAEHTMALLLAGARKIAFYDRLVRAGRWEVPPGKPMFRLSPAARWGWSVSAISRARWRCARRLSACACCTPIPSSKRGSSTRPARKWNCRTCCAKPTSFRCIRRSCRRRAR